MAMYHNLDAVLVSESVLYVNDPELVDRTIIDAI